MRTGWQPGATAPPYCIRFEDNGTGTVTLRSTDGEEAYE